MRNVLIVILLLLWLILAWLYSRSYNTCCSKTNVDTSAVISTPAEKTGPILFKWNDSVPILGEGWDEVRKNYLTYAGDKSKLEIIGHYFTSPEPGESEAFGLSRAREVRKLFPELSDDQIVLVAKALSGEEAFKTSKFEACAFNKIVNESVKETEDGTLIWFPFNSTQKLNSSEVQSYLDDVAKRVIASGESIELVGHTDNVGSDDSNLLLGQKRADVVKSYLVSKGVTADKIVSSSKGETLPIEDNNTENGRAKNRRTELKIIK